MLSALRASAWSKNKGGGGGGVGPHPGAPPLDPPLKVRSFLGPVNVCARFNLDLATVSEQRRTISVGHSTIKRKGQQIEKDAETRFITNASPIGRLGAVLRHVQNGQK